MTTASIIAQGNLFARPEFIPVPVTEVGKREAVLDSFEERETLERRRRKARETSHNPAFGYKRYRIRHATSCDIVNEELQVKVNKFEKINNVNGGIFRGKIWTFLFDISSKREGGHGNKIGVYVLKEHEGAALSDLAALMASGPDWKKKAA